MGANSEEGVDTRQSREVGWWDGGRMGYTAIKRLLAGLWEGEVPALHQII